MSDVCLRLVTWNVHRGRGGDGRVDPARIRRVLRDEVCPPGAADALFLQEADAETPPHAGILDIDAVERETGLRHAHRGHVWGAQSHGFLGAIVLLDAGIRVEDVALLDLPGRCHRGAVVLDVVASGAPLRLIGAHLSLGQAFRAAQMRTIGQHLARRTPRPAVLAGDLNEWRPWSGLALSPRVVGHRLSGPVAATFPVARPILPLDRVLATAPARVERARVLDGPGIRAASDHRPLAAELRLPVP